MKSTASLLSGTQRPGSSVPASICSDLKLGSWTANAAHSVLSESQSWNQRVALSQSHGQIFTQLASQACSPRSGQPLHSKQPAAGQATVPQRLVKLLSYSKLRLLQELRAHQLVSDDEEEGASARRQLKKPTRGPLSEGNRPRQIWALEEVQVLELEILGVAGLNLFDEHGELKVDPKTREPYKKLQGRYAEDARDLLESLLRANHADNFYVQRLEQEAGHQEHILKSEGVRRQLIRLMDRLLRHMEALDIVSLGTLFTNGDTV